MNYLKIITVSFALLLLYSCGSDDNPAEQIVGVWNVTSLEYSDCQDSSNNYTEVYGDASCEDFGGDLECEEVILTFAAAGTIINVYNEIINGEVEGTDTSGGSFTFSESNDDELTICLDGLCIPGTISFSGSTMTFVGVDDDCTVTLKASK